MFRHLALLLVPLLSIQAAEMKMDIEYAKVNGTSLTLDASVPEGEGPFPTCILVHGGGGVNGDKTSYIKPLFDPLSKAGFTWFTIDYRLAPAHVWPACADDVATALQWVREHATAYKVDPARIVLIGESAGGHLVSWVGTTDRRQPPLAAVVAFYAPNDLVAVMKTRTELGGIGKLLDVTAMNETTERKLVEASPINRVRPGLPPFLLIHGDKDGRVPYEQSTLFQQRMQLAGNRCDLIPIPGGDHGMGGWDALPSDYQIQLVDWLRRTLK